VAQRTLYLSTINQASGKVRQLETDALNTEPRCLEHIKQRLLFIYHAVAEQNSQKCIAMVVVDSDYIMTAQDKVGCLTADGNVDDVDLHRTPGPLLQRRMHTPCMGDEGVRTLLNS